MDRSCRRIAVVTDSTASLPPAVAAAHDICVVPLQVVIGDVTRDEGTAGASSAAVAQALRDRVPVSTSRPPPEMIRETYERLAAEGVAGVVSVHLSADMSATVESALLAARDASIAVEVVDGRQVGIATGYAALSAAAAIEAGADLSTAAEAARVRAAAASTMVYVDTLDYLRRGGRIGAAAALLGGALSVKPLLHVTEGRVAPLERQRTAGRALARLTDLAAEAAGDAHVQACVAHLANPQRAQTLRDQLADRLQDQLIDGEVWWLELGAVLGAHVGPGTVAVCIAPLVEGPI